MQRPMAEKCHFTHFLMNLLFMCLNHIIGHETWHYYLDLPLEPTFFTKQFGRSKTREFKCRFLFLFYQLQWNFRVCNIPFERSWKYLSNSILHAPKCFKITVAKQKRKICSHLVTVDQGGQKNCNGKFSNTNYQRIELLVLSNVGWKQH